MADKALNHEKIEVMWNSVLEDVVGDQLVEAAKIKNIETGEVQEVKCEGIFIAIGHKPNTDLFVDQLKMNEVGYLVTEGYNTRTSVEGVFAAGDVADDKYRQAITAAGTGCMAAIDCERWLEENSH
jgi:thioredoxin reductase (NADPH)